jgi:hypothetical protein
MIRNDKSKNIAENLIQQKDLEAMVAEAKSDSSEVSMPNPSAQAATEVKESETTVAVKDNKMATETKASEVTAATKDNKSATATKESEVTVAAKDNKMPATTKESEATVSAKDSKMVTATKESEATVTTKDNKMDTTTKESEATVSDRDNKMAIATQESEVIPAVKEYGLGIATKESETMVAMKDDNDGMVGNGNDASILKAKGALDLYSAKKTIKTVNLSLQNYDSNRIIQNLKKIAEQYGGYIENENNDVSYTNQKKDINLEARTITLKIPKERYDSLITSVATLGSVKQNSEDIKDITEYYMDTESLLEDKKLDQQTLIKLMEKATTEELIPLQKQLNAVEAELDTYTDKINNWNGLIKFSTVIVNLQ